MTPLRKCKKCGKEANTETELKLFVKDSKAKYGYRSICKKCDYKIYGESKKKYRKVKTTHLWERPWLIDLSCRKCGVKLTDENWVKYVKEKHDYICRPCYLKIRKDYMDNHKEIRRIYERKKRADPVYAEKERKRLREYGRKHILGQWTKDGKLTKVKCNKRSWTNICEVCGSETGLRAYHHWNDSNYDNGMWLCRYCHIFAEKVDQGLVQKYLDLKVKIDGRKLEL